MSVLFNAIPFNEGAIIRFSTLEQYKEKVLTLGCCFEIDLIECNHFDQKMWYAVDFNVKKFFELKQLVIDCMMHDFAQRAVLCGIVKKYDEKTIEECFDIYENITIYGDLDCTIETLTDQLMTEIPEQSPIRMYFDGKRYVNEMLINSELECFDGYYCDNYCFLTKK